MQIRKLSVRNIILLAIALVSVPLLQAQDDCGDECKLNSNLAMIVSVPVNPSLRLSAPAGALWAVWGITSTCVMQWSVSSCGPESIRQVELCNRCKQPCNRRILTEIPTCMLSLEITDSNCEVDYSGPISSVAGAGTTAIPGFQRRSIRAPATLALQSGAGS